MENKRSIFKDRRFKYGSLAVTLTVAFVALMIILNVVVYALAYSYGWYIDLTGTQYYGITEASERYLDMVLTDGVEVKIVFCQDKDRVLSDSSGYYIYRCVETYQKAYPNNIKVEYLDVIKYPELADIYTSQTGTPLYTYNVIVETNQSESFRLLTYENFFSFDQETGNVYAFNGEMKLTSSIVGLCTDMPICYFTTMHGERVGDEENGYCALYELLQDAGFEVRSIDLSKEDIDASAKLVVINNPVYDFSATEINKIAYFSGNQQGNVMVFLSPEYQDKLSSLKEWMEEWGVGIGDGQIKETVENSVSPDGLNVIATYPTGDTFAPSLHSELRKLESAPRTLINNPIALTKVWGEGIEKDSRQVDSVLNSSSSSMLCSLKNGDQRGAYSMMMLVRQKKYDNITQDSMSNYLMVSAAGYVEDSYLNSNSYGNRDILFTFVRQTGKNLVPMEIEFKVFASEALDISVGAAYTWTVITVAILPLGVGAIGVAVYIK